MGALVTLELPDGSPMLAQPWIITFGPLTDADEWEPVVCGPYERPHALALAEAVVADEQLMAVVEPLVTAVSVDEIRGEIAAAQASAEDEAAEREDADLYGDYESDLDVEPLPTEAGHREAILPPGEGEIRAGFSRIAELLNGGGRRPEPGIRT
ncbi:hypothetical protein [Plantactinospora sp. KBS50]|uniref:hypothetical protein n=1 Tax=Plantactinospora sp. KBS50 TaxID=2024580 RepID=UPI000BAAD701|nr:hypothetical protein [Plantactinospora sp. KBS50]ASW57404.1 hypothetical protein CIK06_03735 [Plantactinospora sp. KBS50]